MSFPSSFYSQNFLSSLCKRLILVMKPFSVSIISGLHVLGYSGNPHTWSNKREGSAAIFERWNRTPAVHSFGNNALTCLWFRAFFKLIILRFSFACILVHSGGLHAGHYYSFIRPTLSDQWYASCISRVCTHLSCVLCSPCCFWPHELNFIFLESNPQLPKKSQWTWMPFRNVLFSHMALLSLMIAAIFVICSISFLLSY